VADVAQRSPGTGRRLEPHPYPLSVSRRRHAAVLDPLTGLLNRKALELRMVELELQAHLTGDSVCFVACDLDAFKRVNDEYGHDRGDAVLRAAAHELRKALRSFELIYRIGGEESLVVLPGAGMEEGLATGERLRAHLHDCRPVATTVPHPVLAPAGG
jgi:diguanylate cyclase (GGDEF)-like protein